MGSLYKADVVRAALNEVGYVGGKGTSKYSHDLDQCNYWQMPPKDGCPDADWCSIFVNWCIYVSTRNSNGEIDPDKWDAHYFTFEPDSGENLAAGCGYAADYYMAHDAWSDDSSGACVGDQVFFRHFAHTGIVVDWDDTYIYTVEGNTRVDGDPYHVARKQYRLDDPDIDGYGHPRYDGDEYHTSEKEPDKPKEDSKPEPLPEPTPEPTPAPDPEPVPLGRYRVCVKTHLNVRSGPSTSYEIIWKLQNGDEIAIYEIDDGWGRIDEYGWVCMKYLVQI